MNDMRYLHPKLIFSVSLTQTKKKGLELKQRLIEDVSTCNMYIKTRWKGLTSLSTRVREIVSPVRYDQQNLSKLRTDTRLVFCNWKFM